MALPNGKRFVDELCYSKLISPLQYFGRDSMIALRLLMPTLMPEAIEAALGAVIERVNSTGALCHEETIGKRKYSVLMKEDLTSICFITAQAIMLRS